jgi:N-acetylmuramoyl-L-alanine amidase
MYFRRKYLGLIFMLVALLQLTFCGLALADSSLTPIMDKSSTTKEQLIKYFLNNNTTRSYDYINNFATIVLEEAKAEGVRPDVAYSLMMKETNFLKFGGTVQEYQNNFGGLGVTATGVTGEKFPDIRTGIRAVIQHLKGYATTDSLNQPLVDTRYQLINPKGCAQYVEWLGKNENPQKGLGWASDLGYGLDIVKRVNEINSLLPLRMWLDTPNNQGTIRGTTPVTGWAIDASEIAKIEISVDSKYLAQAEYGESYPGVAIVYPGYPNGDKSKFIYNLDTVSVGLSDGWHDLSVKVSANDGDQQTWSTRIKVDNAPKMWVDTPGSGSTVKGKTSVAGWAINMSGIKKVDVFAGDKLLGQATLGISYPGVDNVYPGYPTNGSSGFNFVWDTTQVRNGIYNLKALATGNDGKTTSFNVSVKVDNLPTLMYVDTPIYQSTTRGIINVTGWAISASDIDKVEVYSGTTWGQATTGVAYPALAKVFPAYPNVANGGFSFQINTRNLPDGWQNIIVKVTAKNGETISRTVKFCVDNAPKMWVDTPSSGSAIKGETSIAGWAVNMSGINKVEIFMGDKFLGQATLGISYPAVDDVYPGYPTNRSSGFNFVLDTTQIPQGNQTLRIVATGNDNKTTTFNLNLNVRGLKRTIVLDPGHGGWDPGAVIYSNTPYEMHEADVNLAVALRLRDILIAQGYDVLMTRETNVALTPYSGDGSVSELQARANFSNQSGGDIFISIHADASSSQSATGVLGTYFRPDYGYTGYYPYDPKAAENWPLNMDLANFLASSLASSTSQYQRPSESHAFSVLRNNILPSALIEIGFLTNPDTANNMKNPTWLDKAASGLANGINNYFNVHS